MKITFEVPETTWNFAFCISFMDCIGQEWVVSSMASDYLEENHGDLTDGDIIRVEEAFEIMKRSEEE